jgi:predicted nucleotidyltransferase
METPLWHWKFGEEDINLLRKLNDADVSYIIIGGAAVAYYGGREAHEVDDLDILVGSSGENAEKFADVINAATRDAGAPLSVPVTQSNFSKPKVQFPLKFPPFYCEFQTPASNDDFEAFMSNAIKTDIRGQQVHILARSDLIVMKKISVKEYGITLAKHAQDLKYLDKP